MTDETRKSVLALLANAAQTIGAVADLIVGDETSGHIELREGPVDQETCKHRNKQTFQGAGGAPERTVCVDCMKEF